MKQVYFFIVLLVGLFISSCRDASNTEVKTMDKDSIVVLEDSTHTKMDTTIRNQ